MTALYRIICIVAVHLLLSGCLMEALPTSDGTATVAAISWVAPTTRTDGSPLPLSEIAGFRIYRGTDPNNLILVKDINDPGATDFSVTESQPGTYYYALTTYNIYGLESNFSDVVSKTVT